MHVCDAQKNSIKICTKLKECVQFLKAIGCLYETFSVHNKRARYTVKSAEEAISLVKQCRNKLDENTSDIQGATGMKTTLNGPQGYVSARTVASVAMMDTGIQSIARGLTSLINPRVNKVIHSFDLSFSVYICMWIITPYTNK